MARGDARPLAPHSGAAEREGARAATPALPCDARKRRRRTSTRGHTAPASPRRTRSHGQAANGGQAPGAGADAARPAPASPRADCPQRLSAGGGKDARTGEDDTIFNGATRPPALDGRAGLIASDAAGLREAGQGSPRPAADANGHQQPRDRVSRPRERRQGRGWCGNLPRHPRTWRRVSRPRQPTLRRPRGWGGGKPGGWVVRGWA